MTLYGSEEDFATVDRPEPLNPLHHSYGMLLYMYVYIYV